jgi:pimeloyl-ACP methyl ester carboxylesterase
MKTMNVDDAYDRRRFLGSATMTMAAAGLGVIASASARAGQGAVATLPSVKPGTNTSFGPLKQIDAGLLNIGYAEAGPLDGPAVILLHGWPYDIHSFVDVAPLLASAGYRVIVPYLRGYGTTRFLSKETFRNAQQSAVGLDIIALMDALKIQKATVAGFDWGARTADVMAVLWPERCNGIVSVSGYLISSPAGNQTPWPPEPAFAFWYQYYFATDVGKAGYAKYLDQFNKFIWKQASPKWNFDDATYNRTAASFTNPDHVDIVIHDYRWRLGVADGERRYDDLEKKLAALPVVAVPAITMEGDSNGAIHAPPAAYRAKFSGKYEHRVITGGVGHNLPQEAPQAFAQAVVDVAS